MQLQLRVMDIKVTLAEDKRKVVNVSGSEIEVKMSYKQQNYTKIWSKLQLFRNSQV